jgi:hypothetical protein
MSITRLNFSGSMAALETSSALRSMESLPMKVEQVFQRRERRAPVQPGEVR